MNIIRSILLLCFLTACSASITTQEVVSELIITKNDPTVLEFSGPINSKSFEEFRQNFKGKKILILNSSGGEFDLAEWMALIVHRMNMTVIVTEKCESSCTLVYQAGTKRIITPEAILLYHPLRYPAAFMDQYLIDCAEWTTDNKCEDRFEYMKLRIVKHNLYYFFLLEYYGASKEIFKTIQKQKIDPNWLYKGNLIGYKDLIITPKDSIKYNISQEVTKVYIKEESF